MSNCQDNYCATFRNYPSLLLHQEEQATHSQWERHRVKDLRVEPQQSLSIPLSAPARKSSAQKQKK